MNLKKEFTVEGSTRTVIGNVTVTSSSTHKQVHHRGTHDEISKLVTTYTVTGTLSIGTRPITASTTDEQEVEKLAMDVEAELRKSAKYWASEPPTQTAESKLRALGFQ